MLSPTQINELKTPNIGISFFFCSIAVSLLQVGYLQLYPLAFIFNSTNLFTIFFYISLMQVGIGPTYRTQSLLVSLFSGRRAQLKLQHMALEIQCIMALGKQLAYSGPPHSGLWSMDEASYHPLLDLHSPTASSARKISTSYTEQSEFTP